MTQHTALYTNPDLLGDSPAWMSFIWLALGIAMTLMVIGSCSLPVDWWIRGYLYMGTLFLTAGTLTLSKALRDRHGYERLVNHVKSARTQKVLSKYES